MADDIEQNPEGLRRLSLCFSFSVNSLFYFLMFLFSSVSLVAAGFVCGHSGAGDRRCNLASLRCVAVYLSRLSRTRVFMHLYQCESRGPFQRAAPVNAPFITARGSYKWGSKGEEWVGDKEQLNLGQRSRKEDIFSAGDSRTREHRRSSAVFRPAVQLSVLQPDVYGPSLAPLQGNWTCSITQTAAIVLEEQKASAHESSRDTFT